MCFDASLKRKPDLFVQVRAVMLEPLGSKSLLGELQKRLGRPRRSDNCDVLCRRYGVNGKRCAAAGVRVESEVKVYLSYRTYCRRY